MSIILPAQDKAEAAVARLQCIRVEGKLAKTHTMNTKYKYRSSKNGWL